MWSRLNAGGELISNPRREAQCRRGTGIKIEAKKKPLN
tara:strand:- start:1 stop:114 length:114 start_codon:yes stop_codon:yes gene_type:complete